MKISRILPDFTRKAEAINKRHSGFYSLPKCLFLYPVSVFFLNLIFSGSLFAGCLSKNALLADVEEWAKVAKVIDGDTVHLTDGRKIRFIGINTPEVGRGGEISQPFAHQAFLSLESLLANQKEIGLSYDKDKTDRYKRLLAYITLKDGRSVGRLLLEQGLAFSIAIPPNVKRIDCFRQAEEKARKSKKGIWQLPEMQVFRADELSSKARGYRFVTGQVSGYSESKKSLYLKLTSKLSVRIAKKDIRNFSKKKLQSLVGKNIKVRGWVNRYKEKQSIHLRTSHNLLVLD